VNKLVDNSGAKVRGAMSFPFDSRKAAQAACRILNRHSGDLTLGEVVKLLYLVDRESLIRTGQPVTGDRMISMEHGTMLSRSYSLVQGKDADPEATAVWRAYVGPPDDGYEIHAARGEESYEDLSDWELALIDEIESKFGDFGFNGLRDHGHKLPEWKDPGKSSETIDPRVILREAGWTAAEIATAEEDAKSAFTMAAILRNV
jgi:uncharacterized phage-associated protein